MNRKLSEIGSAVVTVTVFLFAVCIVTHFQFGSYLVCMFLPIGLGEVNYHWLHLPPLPGDLVVETDNKSIRNVVKEMKQLIDRGG